MYLVKGRKCLFKARTTTARRTLEPLYQQPLLFTDSYKGCAIHVSQCSSLLHQYCTLTQLYFPSTCPQVIVWGEYSRLERKSLMGAVQIVLDDLDLSNIVIGWYKLFNTDSFINLQPGGKTSSGSVSGGRSGMICADSSSNLAGMANSYTGGSGGSGPGSLMSASMESFG